MFRTSDYNWQLTQPKRNFLLNNLESYEKKENDIYISLNVEIKRPLISNDESSLMRYELNLFNTKLDEDDPIQKTDKINKLLKNIKCEINESVKFNDFFFPVSLYFYFLGN